MTYLPHASQVNSLTVFAVRDDKARDAVQLFIHVYAGSINERFYF